MVWSKKQHEKELTDAILNQDLDKVEKLAQNAAEHDREVAQQTGNVFWAHRDKWAG